VTQVSFVNVPSFVDREVDVAVPGLGRVRGTIAYGGAFYVYVDAGPLGLQLDTEHAGELIEQGMAIKRAVADACQLRHPDGHEDLDFLYGTIFVAPQPGVPSTGSTRTIRCATGS
jgi:trans-L-3-hydroxyproline dehydratase